MSLYGALLESGMSMADIDEMPFGRYMDVLEVRVKQRDHAKAKEREHESGKNKKTVYLERGTVDALW